MATSASQEMTKFVSHSQLLQRLPTRVVAGRTVEMVNVLKHELSPFPQSLAKLGGRLDQHLDDWISHSLWCSPGADMKVCVLIDGQALIQSLGKPYGCQTFGDLAGVFMQIATHYFGEHITRVGVMFDCYIGEDKIKAAAQSKRVGKQKPIRKLIEGPHVPFIQVWGTFIALDENKNDLIRWHHDKRQCPTIAIWDGDRGRVDEYYRCKSND